MLSLEARRVGLILSLAILAWATDFLHGVRPGVVALIAGLACAVPGLGPLRAADLADRNRLGVVVWVGGVLSIGGVLMETGASNLVAAMLGRLSESAGTSPMAVHLAIAYVTSLLCLPLTVGGAIPIVTSAVGTMIEPAGIPLETGVLSITAGLSALFAPYISAPLVVGIRMGKVSDRDALRFTIWTSLATWALIVPLNALWWRLIGALP
jgi:di/tricarboxylate transporter